VLALQSRKTEQARVNPAAILTCDRYTKAVHTRAVGELKTPANQGDFDGGDPVLSWPPSQMLPTQSNKGLRSQK